MLAIRRFAAMSLSDRDGEGVKLIEEEDAV